MSSRSQHGGSPRGGSQHSGSQHGGPPPGSPRPGNAKPAGSQSGGARSSPFPPGMGFDPARNPTEERDSSIPTRIDLPPEAYVKDIGSTPFSRRPGYNTTGQPTRLRVNQYRVEHAATATIYQYAVSVTPDSGKPIVVKKCWQSRAVQTKLRQFKKAWLYDGRSLAWSMNNVSEVLRIRVDLDEERGQQSRPGAKNEFYLTVKPTSTIYLEALSQYLASNADWDTHILECMNFFDHALRQHPSENLIAIKRNFYHPLAKHVPLDRTVSAAKGLYASFRLSQSVQDGGSGLGINVDVANTTFWVSQTLDQLVRNYLGGVNDRWANRSPKDVMDLLQPAQGKDKAGNTHWVMSDAFKCLRKLQKLRFKVRHRGKEEDKKVFTIKRFAFDSKYGRDGANAKNYKFTIRKTGEERSVFDHFQRQYGVTLQSWRYPVVETTREGAFPLEVCLLEPWQRYNFKLDPMQTSKMINFAVTRPDERLKNIVENVEKLGWAKDPYLKEFGIKVNLQMALVNARVIQNPTIRYGGGGVVNPGTEGRWDLRGKTFLEINKEMTLKSWAFVVINNCVDKATVANFARVFTTTFKGHGGKVDVEPQVFVTNNPALQNVFLEAYQATSKHYGRTPVMLFFVLPDKNQFTYNRLKKNGECRFGMVTQMLNAAHVRKAQPQYCSNVCMKVNAKLGGKNSRVPGLSGNPKVGYFAKPTMMIGVDLSHGAAGAKGEAEPSMAAMAVSTDLDTVRYTAACQTNGYRVEIIKPANMRSMFPRLLRRWCGTNKATPEHVFYFRDGVSEGQFAHVMSYEVKELRSILREVCVTQFKRSEPKITVIVATKRHHVRFFPEQGCGDRNGNAKPGTLVEREVTHPFHYDFYLCSHVALKGTARPVHYHVLHDEVGMKPDDLQKMIYQQCYQYARSTTPVSLHPAVYYAHLASARARAHESTEAPTTTPAPPAPPAPPAQPRPGPKGTGEATGASTMRGAESTPLLPFGSGGSVEKTNADHIWFTMWFI